MAPGRSVKALAARFEQSNNVQQAKGFSHPSARPQNASPSKPEVTPVSRNVTTTTSKPAPVTPSQVNVQSSSTFSRTSTRSIPSSIKRNVSHRLPPAERRRLRYATAEQSLNHSFKHAQEEPTSLELRLRALRQTTALLSYYALEAQADTKRLRSLLKKRDGLGEDEWKRMKERRWLHEKRQAQLLEEHRIVQSLTKQAPDCLFGCSLSVEERRHRNTNLFIEREGRPRGRIAATLPPEPRTRLVRKRNVSPMKLRRDVPLRRNIFSKSSAPSLQSAPTRQQLYKAPRQPHKGLSPFVRKRIDDDAISISSVRSGRVTIFRNMTPPSPTFTARENLMSNLPEVAMPSYARNLMDHFDEQSGAISLPLRRFSELRKAAKPPTSTPLSNAPTLPPLHLLGPDSPPQLAHAPSSSSTVARDTRLSIAESTEKRSKAASTKRRSRKDSVETKHSSVRFDNDHSVWDFFSSSSKSNNASATPTKLTKRPKRRSIFSTISHDSSDRPSALALLISRPKALRRPAQAPMSADMVGANGSDVFSDDGRASSSQQTYEPKISLQLAPPTAEDEALFREAMEAMPSPPSTPTKPGHSSMGRGLAKRLSQVDLGNLTGSPRKLRRAKSYKDVGNGKTKAPITPVKEEP